MTNLLIGDFIEAGKRKDKVVRIQFKKREAINGLFVIDDSYQDIKKKNFWRIVTASNEQEWRRTKSLSCSRLYNGEEFSKLSDL
jgi:hypothetical protein